MKCDKCGKEGFIEINMLSENSFKKINLCFDCYKKLLEDQEELFEMSTKSGDNSLELGNFLNQMISNIFSLKPGNIPLEYEEKTCPTCGTTSTELFEYGNIGCEDCYQTFQEDIKEYFRETRGISCHYGDCPDEIREYNLLREKLIKAESEIEKFILTEEFEKAAEVKQRKEKYIHEMKEWELSYDE